MHALPCGQEAVRSKDFVQRVLVRPGIAYQYGMFPELRPEFGPAQTFGFSLAVRF